MKKYIILFFLIFLVACTQDSVEVINKSNGVFRPNYTERYIESPDGKIVRNLRGRSDTSKSQEISIIKKDQLNSKNAKLMLSNSNPKNVNEEDTFFDVIYNGFVINEVSAKRMINSNAKGRGEISELLITNYEEQSKWNSQITSTIKMKTLA